MDTVIRRMVSGGSPSDVAVLDLSLSESEGVASAASDSGGISSKFKRLCDLSAFSRLRVLDVSGNRLSEVEGVATVAGSLEELLLARNEIRDLAGLRCLTKPKNSIE